MKRLIFILYLFFVLLFVNAQDTTNNYYSPKNKISIDFAGMINGFGNFGFERSFKKNFTLGARVQFGKFILGSSGSVSQQEWSYLVNGYGIVAEAKFYPFNERVHAPNGFFFGVHTRFRGVNEKYREIDNNGGIIEISDTIISNKAFVGDLGLNVGFSIPLFPNVSFDFLYGYGFSFGDFSRPNERDKIDRFYRTEISSYEYRMRVEVSIAIVFPQIKIYKKPSKIKVLDGPYLEH